MGIYSTSPDWADVLPIMQAESEVAPLVQIAYSDDYAEAMSYLRAVMVAEEKTQRVLDLTEALIRMNPTHYTVWLYRSATLKALNSDLNKELTVFLNPLSLSHLKNYQIWHHRQTIIDRLGTYENEHDFLASMFARDAKNYHVWSYRQWLVRRFGIWDDEREWKAVEQLLAEDVRNNSAWNHRWYLAFARPGDELSDAEVVKREMSYAMEKVRIAPQNASPWNYIRGLMTKATGEAKVSKDEVIRFASEFAGEKGEGVRSSHALEILALAYADDEKPEKREDAVNLLEMLAEKYDPIRAPYWRYRIALVNGGLPSVVAAA